MYFAQPTHTKFVGREKFAREHNNVKNEWKLSEGTRNSNYSFSAGHKAKTSSKGEIYS